MSRSRTIRIRNPTIVTGKLVTGLAALLVGTTLIVALAGGLTACSDGGAADFAADGDLVSDPGADPRVAPDSGAGDALAPGATNSDDGNAVDADPQAIACRAHHGLGALQLHEEFCLVDRFSVAPTSAMTVAQQLLWSFDVVTDEGDDNTPALMVEAHALDNNSPVESLRIAALDNEPELVFPGGYVAVSPGGAIAVGFSRPDFSGAIAGLEADGRPLRIEAPGNFDAAWLDDQTLLVNGAGLGSEHAGQGLYVWREGQAQLLVGDLGSFSGYLAVGSSVVHAGGAFGSFPELTNRVFAFTIDELRAAIREGAVLSAAIDGDLVWEGDVSDMAAFDDDLLLIDSRFDFDAGRVAFAAVRSIPAAVSGGRVDIGAAQALIATPVSAAPDNGTTNDDRLQQSIEASPSAIPDTIATDGHQIALRIQTDEGHDIALLRRR